MLATVQLGIVPRHILKDNGHLTGPLNWEYLKKKNVKIRIFGEDENNFQTAANKFKGIVHVIKQQGP